MQGSSHQVIPIFDGDKYEFWSIKMATILKTRSLWSVVDEGIPTEPTGEVTPETATSRTRRGDAINHDLMALQLLQTAVTDHIFSRIAAATTSKEAWDALKTEYEGSTQVRLIKLQTLRREYENLKMHDGESLKSFTDKLVEMENQLTYHGEKKTNAQLVQKILISLPSKYDSIVSVLEQTRDLNSLSMSELIGILKAHEARLSVREEGKNEGAFKADERGGESSSHREYTENRGKEGNKWCSFCKMNNHNESDCWKKSKGYNKSSSSNHKEMSNVKCYHCGRIGHYSSRCRSKKNERAHMIIQEGDSSDDDHMMFNASEFAATSTEDEWLVDSGCTNHMTREEGYFSRLNKSVNVPIKVGNGQVVMTAGKGDITVMTNKGKKEIRNVFLVPGLEKNLLSVPQIIANGYRVNFEKEKCTIIDRKGNEMEIPMTHKSFKVKLKRVQEESKRRTQMITKEEVKKLHARDKAATKLVMSRKRQRCDKEDSIRRKKPKSTSTIASIARITQPKKSFTNLKDAHVKESQLDKVNLRRLIVKAQHKVQEKKQQKEIDYKDITKKRDDARIALDKVVASVVFEDHLKYHSELERLGNSFIRVEVKRLKEFNLLSRDDFNDETKYSVLKRKKPPWDDKDSKRRKTVDHDVKKKKAQYFEEHKVKTKPRLD